MISAVAPLRPNNSDFHLNGAELTGKGGGERILQVFRGYFQRTSIDSYKQTSTTQEIISLCAVLTTV